MTTTAPSSTTTAFPSFSLQATTQLLPQLRQLNQYCLAVLLQLQAHQPPAPVQVRQLHRLFKLAALALLLLLLLQQHPKHLSSHQKLLVKVLRRPYCKVPETCHIATAIAEWDRRILQNRNVLIRLEADVVKVVDTQTSLEQQLELIETHQREVDKALQSMEEEAERIFQDELVLLREEEAPSARNTMCEQAEGVENELQHMTVQVKSIIQTLNATQGGELVAADSMTPFDVAVWILDNQLRSLMWIDEANEFSTRIHRLPNNSAAAERDSGISRFWLSWFNPGWSFACCSDRG